MDTMYPAATFTATRDELVGGEPLLGAAEIARGVCRGADRTVSVLAVTHERMRRIDGWLGRVGFVTHAAAPESSHALLGSVCDRDRASELIREIMDSLVGPLPAVAATTPLQIPALDGLSPSTLPPGVDWVIILSATSTSEPRISGRSIVVAAGGLLVGDRVPLDRACTLDPADADALPTLLANLVGTAHRSIRDVLGDD